MAIVTYIKESYDELLHKVTWPTWGELQQSSVLVFVASLIIAGIVFAMDWVFGRNPAGTGDGFHWDGLLGLLYKLIAG